MKKSTKAVLLSTFVFPGLGHFVLNKYKHGIVLAGISFAGMYYLVSKTVEKALHIAEKIQSGDVRLDTEGIAELVSKQATGAETQLLDIATYTIIICWLIGIVDSYRAGSVQDKND
jgi:hypothetical protein